MGAPSADQPLPSPENLSRGGVSRRDFIRVILAATGITALIAALGGATVVALDPNARQKALSFWDFLASLDRQSGLEKHTQTGQAGERILNIPQGLKEISARNPAEAYVPAAHPAILAELEFIEEFAGLKQETQEKALAAYAKGIVVGLTKTYPLDQPTVIALEAGHQSKASENAKRLHREFGWGLSKAISSDDGASAKGIDEKDLNARVCNLIVEEIRAQGLPFIPVVVPRDFEVDPLREPAINDLTIIEPADAVLPLLYQWEHLALNLKRQKPPIDMARICVHFNDQNPNSLLRPDQKRGAVITSPQFGPWQTESETLRDNIIAGLHAQVRPIKSNYVARPDTTTIAEVPWWYLASYPDNQKDIATGEYKKVIGMGNRVMAWLVAKAQNKPADSWRTMLRAEAPAS